MLSSPHPTTFAFDRGEDETPLLARGPLSAQLLWVLGEEPYPVPQLAEQARALVAAAPDALTDEDLQLTLLVLHELHHQGWPRVAGHWEWHPDLVALAGVLEDATESALRALVADQLPAAPTDPADLPEALWEVVRADDGPSLSR